MIRESTKKILINIIRLCLLSLNRQLKLNISEDMVPAAKNAVKKAMPIDPSPLSVNNKSKRAIGMMEINRVITALKKKESKGNRFFNAFGINLYRLNQ